jgi:glycosyltransferase involved in cell wall biosynthesis
MHIAIDARFINSSTGRYCERLLHYLQTTDTFNRYSVLVLKKDRDYWKPFSKNFEVVVADYRNYTFAEQFGFKRFLTALNPDLVHFGMPQQPIWYKGLAITTFHDLTLTKPHDSGKNKLFFFIKQTVGKYVFKKAAQKSAHIIAISEYTKKDLQAFTAVPEEKISIVYEAGETTIGSATPYAVPFKRYILYVGQQSNYKNLKRLGDAHQKIRETYPELGLVLVGKKDTAAQKNEAYFNEKGYTGIHFTGFVEDAQLNWLYQQAEAYIFPSLMEGFGLPGLEAMAHGVPVISSDATCLPEVYANAAHYFNPNDTVSMVHSIAEVLSNPTLKEQLITNGYQRIKNFSWKRMAIETHSIYEKVLKDLAKN